MMNLPQVVSREEWLAARKELLAKEKEATRAREALNAERHGLPMVEVEKDTSFVVVSRAPLEKIEAYKSKKNWTFPWYSSFGGDFNYDFHVTMDESVAPAEYNYRSAAEHRQAGMPWYTEGEQPGESVFLREDESVFHTYSAFARGLDHLASSAMFLDLTPLGRQEG
jgi:predicted dithiol-disulfide oxidoreductase (DUF899 family)